MWVEAILTFIRFRAKRSKVRRFKLTNVLLDLSKFYVFCQVEKEIKVETVKRMSHQKLQSSNDLVFLVKHQMSSKLAL